MSQPQTTSEAKTDYPRRGPTMKGRTAVFALLGLSVAVFGLIVVVIWWSRTQEPAMKAPPVGAGAGETGMYNQYMGKERPAPPQPTSPAAAPNP